jgi:P27 family predicted phage terminase small subunit
VSRRPKPTAIKVLEGNPGGRPLNTEEPKPKSGIPEMPKELRKTAQREWRRVSVDLDTLGLITVVDGKALAMYCDAYADWEVAQRECVKSGMWYEEPIVSKDGMVVGYKHKQAPWFNVKCMAMKMMKAYLIEFGLTPASRSKLKIEKKQDGTEMPTREETRLPDDDIDLNSIDETKVM